MTREDVLVGEAKRRKLAETKKIKSVVALGPKCRGGSYENICCVGQPYDVLQSTGSGWVYHYSEPLDQMVIDVAAHNSIAPHDLDWHVTACHGWESHDMGYTERVIDAAYCLLDAGYRDTHDREKCREE